MKSNILIPKSLIIKLKNKQRHLPSSHFAKQNCTAKKEKNDAD